LLWPARIGVATLVIAVLTGADGWAPLLAFGLGGFAAGAALRQIALATRRHGWRGLVGRANGGMVVHLGVILVAVALAASNSHTHSATIELEPGREVAWGGHTFELIDVVNERDARTDTARANVLLDRTQVYGPAVTTYLQMGMTIGTPSVRTGLAKDVSLPIDGTSSDASRVVLRVFVKPMILWLWIGGALMAIGTIMSAIPARLHRRPTDPTSVVMGVADP
jgi:cytochrome c-type biogenesis protein CcmF